jgi:hypothetical protein
MCGCTTVGINTSRNHEFHTHKQRNSMNVMTQKMASLLERLAEMFPQQTYQTRLEAYLSQHQIDNPARLEHLQRQFDQNQQRSCL